MKVGYLKLNKYYLVSGKAKTFFQNFRQKKVKDCLLSVRDDISDNSPIAIVFIDKKGQQSVLSVSNKETALQRIEEIIENPELSIATDFYKNYINIKLQKIIKFAEENDVPFSFIEYSLKELIKK